jgi:hypothetical protein
MKTEFDFANSIPKYPVGSTPRWKLWTHLSELISSSGKNPMTGMSQYYLPLVRPLIKREGVYFYIETSCSNLCALKKESICLNLLKK